MKFITKATVTKHSFRINIPQHIIQLLRWGDVRFVLIEDHSSDKIVIRRLVDGKALNTEDHRG